MEALQTRRCPHGKVMDDACYRCDADELEEGFINHLRGASKSLEDNIANGALSPAVRDYQLLAAILRDAANRIEWRDRQILQADSTFNRIRSLLRGLPRSATAESIDRVCAGALGEPEEQWPGEHGQFGVGA